MQQLAYIFQRVTAFKEIFPIINSQLYISLADRANISLAPWQRTLTVYNSVAKPAVAAYLKVSEETAWTEKPQKLKQGRSYFLNLLDHDFFLNVTIFSTKRFRRIKLSSSLEKVSSARVQDSRENLLRETSEPFSTREPPFSTPPVGC